MEKNECTMSYREELEKELRTIKARDYVFTPGEMSRFRIRGVFNSVGEIERMGDEYIQTFSRSVVRADQGEIGVIEVSIKSMPDIEIKNPLKVISVIVFVDIWSWQMYAMVNKDIYLHENHNLQPLMN